MIPSEASWPEEGGSYELISFDVRVPGALRRLISEGAAWRGYAHVELLDPHHAVLIVRASGAAYDAERKAA